MKSITEIVNERKRFVPFSKRNKSTEKNDDLVNAAGQTISDEFYASNGKLMKMARRESDVTKPAKSNSSRGVSQIKEPVADKAFDMSKLSKSSSRNVKNLIAKFRAHEDFFVQGKAGWAKTSLIESMAAAFNLTVCTVFLDKALATDLGGIPIPTKGKTGIAQQEYAMPGWAAEMLEHPEKQYLLFFDEMNQAPTDVQNALMPIILKHEICGIEYDNFFVGAAGNLEEENRGVSALSGPLKSRFKPIINWETNTEETWKEAFDYLHSKWDDSFGKEFIDKFEENAEVFANPREIEHKIFKFLKNLINSGEDNSIFDADFFYERLIDLANEDEISLTHKERFEQLAEYIEDYLINGGKTEKDVSKSQKTREMIDKDTQETVIDAVRDGYIDIEDDAGGPDIRWGVTEENVYKVFEDMFANREQFNRFMKKIKSDGIDFYYKTNADCQKDGIKPYTE